MAKKRIHDLFLSRYGELNIPVTWTGLTFLGGVFNVDGAAVGSAQYEYVGFLGLMLSSYFAARDIFDRNEIFSYTKPSFHQRMRRATFAGVAFTGMYWMMSYQYLIPKFQAESAAASMSMTHLALPARPQTGPQPAHYYGWPQVPQR